MKPMVLKLYFIIFLPQELCAWCKPCNQYMIYVACTHVWTIVSIRNEGTHLNHQPQKPNNVTHNKLAQAS